MAFSGIQILGLGFSLSLVYFSYLFLRKKYFGLMDFLLWGTIGIFFGVVVIFPSATDEVLRPFGVIRALDLLTIGAIIVAFAILFSVYAKTSKMQKKIELIVEKQAIKKIEK